MSMPFAYNDYNNEQRAAFLEFCQQLEGPMKQIKYEQVIYPEGSRIDFCFKGGLGDHPLYPAFTNWCMMQFRPNGTFFQKLYAFLKVNTTQEGASQAMKIIETSEQFKHLLY